MSKGSLMFPFKASILWRVFISFIIEMNSVNPKHEIKENGEAIGVL